MPTIKGTKSKTRARKPPTRDARKALTHERVLRAALEIFSEEGFEKASTAAIARKAGVSHGTVFVVAPTKERLAVAAFEASIRGVVERSFLAAEPGAELVDTLEHVFGKLFDYYMRNPALSRALLRHLTFSPDPEAKRQYDGLIGEFIGAIERRFAERQTSLHPEIGPRDAARQCFAVYLYWLLLLLNGEFPNREEHRRAFRRQLDAAMRGIMRR